MPDGSRFAFPPRLMRAAAAIGVFLRHFGSSKGAGLHSFTVPDGWGMPTEIRILARQLDSLAAAVERVAGGGG